MAPSNWGYSIVVVYLVWVQMTWIRFPVAPFQYFMSIDVINIYTHIFVYRVLLVI